MDWVIKVGGSLFPKDAVKLCQSLVGESVMIICGGGKLADQIRSYHEDMVYSDTTAHWAAVLCMDINGMLLSDKVIDSVPVTTLKSAEKVLATKKLPILLPYGLLSKNDTLEHSWRVTSDSLSLYIAHLLKAKLLIATDVDGIYNQKPSQHGAQLIRNISAKKLLDFGETSVDEFLSELLLQHKSSCYVVNGKYPERVLAVIEGRSQQDNKYTLIGGN